eukprot:TRINITY_DN455_c0_g1_i2.p1 TRINITY_DN455_c0_g1~~TRINITY_DN455_c0_g1_i2.p1  ORF type:complete len:165 (+),score=48.68 TRINITY_DN455_c0_g1_i2:512-1006(+)
MRSNINKNKGNCASCGKQFGSSSTAVNIGGSMYHAECFVCNHCGGEIDSKFQRKDGKVYHQQCFSSIQSKVKCYKCDLAISGKYVKLKDSDAVYHSSCFTCTKCSKSLSGGYVLEYGDPYCGNCSSGGSSTSSGGKFNINSKKIVNNRKQGFTINPMTGQKRYE